MPNMPILCKECARKKREIEENGAFEVVYCKPLNGQQNVPEEQKKCEIKWKIRRS